jgi:alanine racemase
MLTTPQLSSTSVQRDAWVEIDLSALEDNIRVIKDWTASSVMLMAVVKGDAYGHGAKALAPILQAAGANWFGVAAVDEGLELRQAGISLPILILGPCPSWAVASALEANLDFTITSLQQVKELATESAKRHLLGRVHIKLDTGMHRLGAHPAELSDLIKAVKQEKSLRWVGLYSHLAEANNESKVSAQNKVLQSLLHSLIADKMVPDVVHLASGEAARRFSDTHYDLVRVGLYMYGLEPNAVSQVVQPVMSLRGRINQLKDIDAGQSVGYGFTWEAKRKTKLASVPIGYADGVDRRLSNYLTGLLAGQSIKQVGLISMDQMLFDVTDVASAQIGDVITLIGSAPAVNEDNGVKPGKLYLADWAKRLDTITYELACRLSIRLPRIYTRQKSGARSDG